MASSIHRRGKAPSYADAIVIAIKQLKVKTFSSLHWDWDWSNVRRAQTCPALPSPQTTTNNNKNNKLYICLLLNLTYLLSLFHSFGECVCVFVWESELGGMDFGVGTGVVDSEE